MTLFELNVGDTAFIQKVKGRGAFRKRITEMGFVVGKEVTVIKKAPLQDPTEYNIMGYNVSLRNSEAKLIEVSHDASIPRAAYSGTFISATDEPLPEQLTGKTIHVALVGNPNSGKTTLYNYASGANDRVGNYSGVTVDARESRFRFKDYEFVITDLPGTYSITAYSPEELFVRDFIYEKMPDVVVNVIDASNLERNLFLTTQLIDMDIRLIVALNMFDELQQSGNKLDYVHLGNMLGIPFIPTVASRGKGIEDLFLKIIEVHEGLDKFSRHIHINYGNSIERAISAIQDKIWIPGNREFLDKVSSRFLSIKLLEKDQSIRDYISSFSNREEIIQTSQREVSKLELDFGEDTESLITDAKYGFIAGAMAETFRENPEHRRSKSDLIDTIITHKFWGIPIFIFIMWATFYGTFKIGQYPMNWIEVGVEWISSAVQTAMPPGMLKDLLTQGIIGGVGGVLIFLPNIVLLYLFISLMEDTGYMARAVFIMDKVMHKIGLHGKSFIPLVMGFGCNVPAVLSTRIIESKRDRLITMLINPFMSCSARLPVYILFISAFFTRYQGSILFAIYGLGIMLAVFSALLFRKTIFRQKDVPFVMELPPYRLPTFRSIIKHMWHRAGQYLRKIAGVIMVASIIIWALGYFPQKVKNQDYYNRQLGLITAKYDGLKESMDGNIQAINKLSKQETSEKKTILSVMKAEQQQNSYIGKLGRFIEPVMRPLGFDWKMSVALLTGISAKEVVVGSLGILYQTGDSNNNDQSLIAKLRSQVYMNGEKEGSPVFTPLVALTFMIFILIYFPCIGVVTAISRESGSWKWALFIITYTTILAYFVSLVISRIGSLII
ncbi:MAG TPA: ferrous iron transport protein B [Bacteroidales bacterium]|nr:ferrous iron transport protein B [Bacteroidales bacterium]HPT01655.1 ferrous iron transport protein B [Bacteroidales bacterium]